MQLNLRIAIWNANGIVNHINEIETFLNRNCIDILVSETHFSQRSYFKIRGYDIVFCNHPGEEPGAGRRLLLKRILNMNH